MISDATAAHLQSSFEKKNVVGLLAHHQDSGDSVSLGIELFDTVMNSDTLATIAPQRAITVHLGVCRSKKLIEALKSRCGQVCVVTSHAQVEPEYFRRIFARTVQLWRQEGGEYAQVHIKLRKPMLDKLGTG